ncbi:hypothetical protein M408DRAFT_232070 [Serendipita vermifera MAFF 305830]|uniref:Uncharacterized protein n=1 Tax=Serendipita vermifera MAFF 305830 TaxID=933852 RepID=A0A0C3AYY5_SERVB|nr:hypothetical protein M408DRAFT_232070 [Serendipita vermifera MAFF 305830]
MAGPLCNLPEYYEMVKALAFISSFGFGACTAAGLQVATSDHPVRIRGGTDVNGAAAANAASEPNFLRKSAKKLILEVRSIMHTPSSMFALAASFYAVGLILSLPLNLLLTWQTAARAAAEPGVVRSMIGMNVYISLVAVIAGAVLTGQALKSIKPIVGWITLGAVALVALTFVVILTRVHTNPAWNDPEPRGCVWYTGV